MSAPKLNDLGAQNQAAYMAVEVKVTKREIRYVLLVTTVTMPLLIVKNKIKQNKTQVGLCADFPEDLTMIVIMTMIVNWLRYGNGFIVATGVARATKSNHIDVNVCSRQYRLSGHSSRPENWLCFQRSHMCTWQCRTLKCSATRPAFSSVRNVSRLCFLPCTMSQ